MLLPRYAGAASQPILGHARQPVRLQANADTCGDCSTSPRRALISERVLEVGCGVFTLELARAVGLTGRVAALDISGPMLAEREARAGPPASPMSIGAGRGRHHGAGRVQFAGVDIGCGSVDPSQVRTERCW